MWWKFMQDVPFNMAPLSSFTVTRRAAEPFAPPPVIEPEEKELPEGLWDFGEGRYQARCCGCGNFYKILCDPEEFTESMSYCGGSQYCVP